MGVATACVKTAQIEGVPNHNSWCVARRMRIATPCDFWYNPPGSSRDPRVSEQARRTKTVFDAVAALHDAGCTPFRPGDVTAHLRANDSPIGAWEVRGELTNLERLGLIRLDEDSATWRIVNRASFSVEEAKAAREDG